MEHWLPVRGYPAYFVSDLGNLARTLTYGKKPRAVWKLCAIRIKRDGYVQFHISKDGRAFDLPAHRLVWEAFNGPILKPLEINHKNSIRHDNRLHNLELVTRSQNAAYAYSHNGRLPPNNPNPGSRNGSAKLKEEDIPKIIELYDSGWLQRDIGDFYGVTQSLISMIIRGEGWRHVKRTST